MISLIALNWQFYQSLYTISSNSEVLRNGSIHDYWGSVYETRALGGNGSLNLPLSGQLLNSLKGSFKKTLDQIEKISEINIEPKKENIIFSHGGYLIATYGEKELIAHPFGDGSLLATGRYGGNERITWSEAKLKASQTVFDGYNDYSLPKVEWLNYFMGNKPFESTNDERIFWAIDVKENDFGEKEAAVVSAQSYGYDKQWSNIADFTYYNYWPFRIHFVKKP
jgi:hypothetical protein